jgi:hypothetical protein
VPKWRFHSKSALLATPLHRAPRLIWIKYFTQRTVCHTIRAFKSTVLPLPAVDVLMNGCMKEAQKRSANSGRLHSILIAEIINAGTTGTHTLYKPEEAGSESIQSSNQLSIPLSNQSSNPSLDRSIESFQDWGDWGLKQKLYTRSTCLL